MGRPANNDDDRRWMQALGRLIRTHRRRKRMKASTLAELCRVTEQSVSHWENGKVLPTLNSLRLISAALDTATWRLLQSVETVDAARLVMQADRKAMTRKTQEEANV